MVESWLEFIAEAPFGFWVVLLGSLAFGGYCYYEYKIPVSGGTVFDRSEETIMIPIGGGCTSDRSGSSCSPPTYIPSHSFRLWDEEGRHCPINEGQYRIAVKGKFVYCKWR